MRRKAGSEVGRRRQPPVSSLSAFSYIPPRRDGPAKLSYFYREAQGVSTYDSIFKRPEGYNKKLHRCDREHSKSLEYGRRINKPIEQPMKGHARINHVQAEFYRKNGITCLLEKPSPSLDPC
uniref:Chromosome 5 open reading frame 49 n=1 Tax=Anas platyrhynchos TaxID=8839 RepID=A0A8B9R3S7_ANAPL